MNFGDILLVIAILCEAGCIYLLSRSNDRKEEQITRERQEHQKLIKDLTDKLYFVRTNDFITNKAIEQNETPVEQTKNTEEPYVPLEDMDAAEILASLNKHG